MKQILFFLVVLFMSAFGFAQTKVTHQKSTYLLTVQHQSYQMNVVTSDRALLEVAATAYFFIDKADVAKVHETLGPGYADIAVPDVVKSEISKTMGRHSFEEIVSTKRDEIEGSILKSVHERLAKYHVQLSDLRFTDILPPESVQKAIQARMVAEQNLLAEKHRLKAAEMKLEAEKKEEAERAKINNIVASGLQKRYLQLKYIEALEKLALSENSKVIVLSGGKVALPSFEQIKELLEDEKKKKK
jgi:regulator of protease activity HflC (stomatin/prohibitin superfamily)